MRPVPYICTLIGCWLATAVIQSVMTLHFSVGATMALAGHAYITWLDISDERRQRDAGMN